MHIKIISNNSLTNTAQYSKPHMSFDNNTMKTTITIETDSPERAAEILALISGTQAKTTTPVVKKKAPVVQEVEVEVEVVPEAPVVQEVEVEVVPEAPVVQEVEVVESTRTEAEVTAKAKELVAAASPTVLRAVLDSVIGVGVKISTAPAAKYASIYEAIVAKIVTL
jgi:hypothetical protein